MKGFLLRSIYIVLVVNHANDGPSDHLRSIRIFLVMLRLRADADRGLEWPGRLVTQVTRFVDL
jgi:hypothetical protein